MAIEAFMLPAGPASGGGSDQRLALWHAPGTAASDWRGVVLYAHPFAEEMNKTRRMAALQARALAARGYGVLQVDLKGCGDSSGDFGDATWADWVADLGVARQWLRQRSAAPLTVWGLRAGCLVAADAAAQWSDECCDFVFWQPAPNGSGVLRQFLRQAAAAEMMTGGANSSANGSGKGVVEGLRQQLGAGQAVEVSGYRVHPALATGLEQARLPLPKQLGRVGWFEVSARPAEDHTDSAAKSAAESAALSPAGATASAHWRATARAFHAQVVIGPPFWQTSEIETAPALVEATVAWMTAA